jgi:SAM-dependent methyltransferase
MMRNLFRPPSEALSFAVAAAVRAVHAATPLSGAHAKELPFAVRDLSRLLTQDRSGLSSSYWVNRRLLTAYCRYFLPWNLLRLSRLLPGMDLPLPEGATVLDLGSGPLTMPLALWIAKPGWREMPLTIVCSDVSPAPMTLGRDIFRRLAPDSPWTIELVRGPMEKVLREFARPAALITAANVLNEIRPSRGTPLQNRLAALMRRIAGRLAPEGRFLAVEPGTRLGGKLMALTRLTAFGALLVPEAPCPHWAACPMLAERSTGWCHFSHRGNAAPKDLMALAKRAGLGKDSLSLSCLLLRQAAGEELRRAREHLRALTDEDYDSGPFGDPGPPGEADCDEDGFGIWAEAFAAAGSEAFSTEARNTVRILSDPIRLPGRAEPARYACSGRGLALAHNALRAPSGAAVTVRWPERETRDPKTGALVVVLPPAPARKPAADAPAKAAGQRKKERA